MAEERNLVLYRKYRPKDFDEVVGQDHVVRALGNALATNRVAHAYLFSGPRGVGKTTIARIIAKSLNCTGKERPCNSCDSCKQFNEGRAMDLIEIDAASNRGIDEIRELREGVRTVPSQGKFKTYIIDECHQLTKDASNALLKTLEEPPAHAVFILATTELDKVLQTIISRTQHYVFRRPSVGDISARLQKIAKKEGVILEPEGARLIAFAAEGGMRDAESILGQIMAVEDKKITRTEVEEVLGIPRREGVKNLFRLIAEKDIPESLKLVQQFTDQGYESPQIMKVLMQYFRNAFFLKIDPALKKYVEEDLLPDEHECIAEHLGKFAAADLSRAVTLIFQNIQQFKKTPIPQLPLELTVVELIVGSSSSSQQV